MTAIYTADEQLHQQHAAQCQRDRFLMRWLNGQQPRARKPFAREIESAIAERLAAAGHSVTRAAYHAHYDLLVDGLRVEVKAAARSSQRYQAALRSNEADVLILCCRNGADHFFVIPFDQVAGRTNIAIWSADPRDYTGQFRNYLEAWHLIDQLIAAGVNHWQPPLLKETHHGTL
jgi:hypothetical protein